MLKIKPIPFAKKDTIMGLIRTILAGSVLGLGALSASLALVGQAAADTVTTTDTIVNHVDSYAPSSWGGDHMHTTADLHIVYRTVESDDGSESRAPISAYISGNVHTWEMNVLAGYHGTTQVKLGSTYVETPQYRYGVDGRWIGVSDRNDPIRYDVPVKTALADRASVGGRMYAEFWHS